MSGTVLLRRSSLGDVVLLGAVTGSVPGPVTVVTAPTWAPLAASLAGVDRVVSWPREARPADLARTIGGGRWVDLQDSVRSRWLCMVAGQPTARVHKRSVARRLRLLGVPVPPRPPVGDLYAEACGVAPREAPWIELPGATRDALALLPGATWATKRWAPERFSAVGRAWDGPVVVLGSMAERTLCAGVADGVPGATVLCEDGFDQTLEALTRVRVAVGNDSGLLHLAGACGIPVVAVFGSTHPDDGFFAWPAEVVQEEVGCRPCTLKGRVRCPLGDLRCLEIEPERVIAAVERVCGC